MELQVTSPLKTAALAFLGAEIAPPSGNGLIQSSYADSTALSVSSKGKMKMSVFRDVLGGKTRESWSCLALERRLMLAADCSVETLVEVGTTDGRITTCDTASQNKTIVFIDTSVDDYELLMDAIADDADLVLLDPDADPLEQIGDALAPHRAVRSIHIVSHGSDGQILVGDHVIDAAMLNRRRDWIARWHDSLHPNADILIYGCNVARSSTGNHLITTLSEITGADVAASNDSTGNTENGADWLLESAVGTIEEPIVFVPAKRNRFSGTLDVVINASGLSGEEQFQLQIDGNVVQTFQASTQEQAFTFETDESLTGDQVRVEFINDLFFPNEGIDRNLLIQSVEISGQTILPDDENVFSSGTWIPGEGIVPGFGRGGILHANGYMQFGPENARGEGSTIVVNAAGQEGFERFALQAGNQQFQQVQVSQYLGSWIFQTEAVVQASDVRVSFVNDTFFPGFVDYNLTVDSIYVDGVRFDAESPDVYVSGGYRPGVDQNDGFLETELLVTNGYFDFGGREGDPPVIFNLDENGFGNFGSASVAFGLDSTGRDVAVANDGRIAAVSMTRESFADPPFQLTRITMLNEDGGNNGEFAGGQSLDLNAIAESVLGPAPDGINSGYDIAGLDFDGGERLVVVAERFENNGDFAVLWFDRAGNLIQSSTGNLNTTGEVSFRGAETRFALDSSNRVVIGGQDVSDQSIVVTRYLLDGRLDESFGDGGFSRVSINRVDAGSGVTENLDLTTLRDGSIAILVDQRFRDDVTSGVIKLTSDGQLDDAFGDGGVARYTPGPNPQVAEGYKSIRADNQGRVVIGGIQAIRRLNADGSPDGAFGNSVPGLLELPTSVRDGSRGGVVLGREIEVDAEGNLYFLASDHFVRVTANGQLDTTLSQDGVQVIGEGTTNLNPPSPVRFELDIQGRLVAITASRPLVSRYIQSTV